MAFKFGLERVLDYRRQREDQAMQNLAVAVRKQEAEELRRERLKEELDAQEKAMASRLADAGQRWLTMSFIKALREDIFTATANLELLWEETRRLQAELLEKSKEKKLLDSLKERQAERHAREENLREQRENDETTTIRHGQKAHALL
ncbi:MAG: flagellar export protein FliJ [Desulfovibrionaceae bacterium]|nr:flagellar export protein FliJ [Desulfovibrionaceae bacterium]